MSLKVGQSIAFVKKSFYLVTNKYNVFFIESGKLKVLVWKNSYDLIDDTEISAGQFHIVPPGEYHKFEALEDTIAFELYWAGFDPNDIVRDKQGGRNGA